MDQVLHGLLDVPGGLALALIGLLVFAEAGVFVGFVFPGETAVVLGGLLASTGRISLVMLVVVVVACAVVGDSVGYEVGRHFGPRLLRLRLLRRHGERLEAARTSLGERGGWAVFLGRFTAFLRAVMPGLAGLSRMRYPTFLAYNAAGGVTWGTGVALLGYFSGTSYSQVESWLGRSSALLLAVFVLVLGTVLWRRRRRRRRRWAVRDRAGTSHTPPRGEHDGSAHQQ